MKHALAALIRKAAIAKKSNDEAMVVWGTGTPRREFLHSDDLAKGCVFLMNLPDVEFDKLLSEDIAPLVNIGVGEDVTIRELAEMIARVVEFDGKLVFDTSKPDGTPRKLMDSGRIHAMGWRHEIELETGILRTWNELRESSSAW